jgi:hypothetical protein
MSAEEQKPPKPKGRKKTENVPFDKACELVGGEENLKAVLDPRTGKPIFPRDWRDGRGRWYGWKGISRGVPSYVLLPAVAADRDKVKQELDKLRQTLHATGSNRGPVQALARWIAARLTPSFSGEITLSVKEGKITRMLHSEQGDIPVAELFRILSE